MTCPIVCDSVHNVPRSRPRCDLSAAGLCGYPVLLLTKGSHWEGQEDRLLARSPPCFRTVRGDRHAHRRGEGLRPVGALSRDSHLPLRLPETFRPVPCLV